MGIWIGMKWGGDKACDTNHVRAIRLRQIDGLTGDLIEFGQVGRCYTDQDVGSQIAVADFHDFWG